MQRLYAGEITVIYITIGTELSVGLGYELLGIVKVEFSSLFIAN